MRGELWRRKGEQNRTGKESRTEERERRGELKRGKGEENRGV